MSEFARQMREAGFVVEEDEEDNRPSMDRESVFVVEEDTDEEEPIRASDINTGMYEGMRRDEAAALRQRIEESEGFERAPWLQRAVGGFDTYTDPETGERVMVPQPRAKNLESTGAAMVDAVQGDFSGAWEELSNPRQDVNFADMLFMGVQESGGDAVEFFAALAGDGALEQVREITRDVNADGVMDSFATDAAPAMLAGLGTGAAIMGMARGIPILYRGAAAFFAGEATASLTVNEDEGTVAIGPDAMFPLLGGINLGDSDASEVIENRLNTLSEGIVLSGVLGTGAKAVKESLTLLGNLSVVPIIDIFRGDPPIERDLIRSLVDPVVANKTTEAGVPFTPTNRAAAAEEVAETIRKGSKEHIASLRDLAKDEELVFDTVSAYQRVAGGNDPDALMMAQRRNAVLQRGSQSPRTTMAVDSAGRRLENELDTLTEQAGRENARNTINQGGRELAGVARDTVNLPRSELDAISREYEEGVAALQDRVLDDERVMDLVGLTGTDRAIPTGEIKTEMAARLRGTFEEMNSTKNSLYNEIQGGELDTDVIYEMFKDLTPANIQSLDTILQKDATLNQLVKRAQPRELEDGVVESVEQTKARFSAWLEAKDYDFGRFYREILPQLSETTQDLLGQNASLAERSAGKILRKAVHSLNTDLVEPIRRSNPELAENVDRALDYYKTEFAPVWRDNDVLEAYSRLHRNTVGRFGDAGVDQLSTGSRDLVDQITDTQNPFRVEQVAKAVEVGGEEGKLFGTYYSLNLLEDLAMDVRVNNLNPSSVGSLDRQARQIGEIMQKVDPDAAESINRFVDDLMVAVEQGQDVTKKQEALTAAVDQAKAKIQQSELSRFIDNTENLKAAANPEAAFREMFNRGSLDDIAELIDQTRDLPEARGSVVRDAIAASYSRYFHEKVYGARITTGGVPSFKDGAVRKVLNESDRLLEVGRVIHADKPQVMEAVESLLNFASMTSQSKSATPVPAMSPTAFNQEAGTALNRIIYAVVGPLSRTGTRIRAAVGAGIERMAPNERAIRIMDRILADPDYAADLIDKYYRKPMDPDIKDQLVTFFVSGLLKIDTNELEGAAFDVVGFGE